MQQVKDNDFWLSPCYLAIDSEIGRQFLFNAEVGQLADCIRMVHFMWAE